MNAAILEKSEVKGKISNRNGGRDYDDGSGRGGADDNGGNNNGRGGGGGGDGRDGSPSGRKFKDMGNQEKY